MHRRREIESKLKGETLGRRGLLKRYDGVTQLRITPDLHVVKIGGHGIVDYGAPVLKPLAEEIGLLSRNHQMMIVTGGGVRVRHIMDIGLDLGMPTGVLAELSGKVSEQNSIMMSVLLSEYGGTRIHSADLLDLPMLLRMGILPVTHGTPPYGLYESPSEIGMIPAHRTDTGAFLMAEVLGAKSCIFVKNVDGLFTENPFDNPDAELIEEITAAELMDLEMDDLVIEEKVVEMLQDAKCVRQIHIINGHVPGTLTRLLNGERVGSIIKA